MTPTRMIVIPTTSTPFPMSSTTPAKFAEVIHTIRFYRTASWVGRKSDPGSRRWRWRFLAWVCQPWRELRTPIPASNWLAGRSHVAGRHLVLVSCESAEDFSLFALRHLEEVEAASKLARYCVEFFWRDLEGSMRFFET